MADIMTETREAAAGMYEQYRLECEARAWLKLVRVRGKAGPKWWHAEQKPRLIEKRGIDAVNKLCAEMERQR